MTGRGYFPVPNRVLIEACRRPVAASVYMALAGTPGVWTARGSLKPFEVRASRAELVKATGATPKRIRGALAWLERCGFLERQVRTKAAPVYRLVLPERAKFAKDATATPRNHFHNRAATERAKIDRKGPSWGPSKGPS